MKKNQALYFVMRKAIADVKSILHSVQRGTGAQKCRLFNEKCYTIEPNIQPMQLSRHNTYCELELHDLPRSAHTFLAAASLSSTRLNDLLIASPGDAPCSE